MQTKRRSITESVTNGLVGVCVALGSQYVVFPIFGVHVSLYEHLGITAWFTAISLVRSYLLRRWFTKNDELPPRT